MSDPTKGDSPILDPGPIVDIGGTPFPIRRLGVRDTFTLAKIVAMGARAMGVDANISNEDMAKPEVMQQLMLAGLMAAEDTVLELTASLLGVKVKDLVDPEQFPMSTPLEVAAALVEHQDLKAFFAHVQPLIAKFAKTAKTQTA